MVKRSLYFLLSVLIASSLCCGCDSRSTEGEAASPSSVVETTVPATVPADGDPNDVTCKGSYTADTADADAVVATAGDHELTNSQLQVWYWLAVADRVQGDYDAMPDLSLPLDTQPCPIDDSVNSWQQYFLKQALNAWHSACALELRSREEPLPTEEAYQPNLDNYETYMTGMPAAEYLYGYASLYQPNSMHETYLESLPTTLEELAVQKGYASLGDMAAAFGTSAADLTETVRMFNYSYMYFTTLSYYVECTEEQILLYQELTDDRATEGYTVDIRHILLVPHDPEPESLPYWASSTEATEAAITDSLVTVAEDGTVTCPEELWTLCMEEAEELLLYWDQKTKETAYTFSELAVKHSDDAGSAVNGGIYLDIRQGQLLEELDAWCFDPARESGDTTIIRSQYGCHILYFTGKTDIAYAQAEETLLQYALTSLVGEARTRYPARIDYSAIALTDGDAAVSSSEVLYPDIAHERFPEVPLYLQQDYPGTQYGNYPIRTNGCGITTLAMLASYMADDELTPPEMCARYGSYSHRSGTDGMIFNYEPAVLGFYLREKTYDNRVALAALEEGQIVISVQHKGYWTRGGHYIVLEKLCEDGRVQVRDSNIYNYARISSHVEDRHTWSSIISDGDGFWIYEDKITRIPACSRCGTPEDMVDGLLTCEYLCEKCTPALLRRNAYLAACGQTE